MDITYDDMYLVPSKTKITLDRFEAREMYCRLAGAGNGSKFEMDSGLTIFIKEKEVVVHSDGAS